MSVDYRAACLALALAVLALLAALAAACAALARRADPNGREEQDPWE